MRKNNRAGGIELSDFRQYYKNTIIKTIWRWYKNRHIYQGSRIENPEINLNIYNQLIYKKGGNNIQWRKNSLFNKWCWKN